MHSCKLPGSSWSRLTIQFLKENNWNNQKSFLELPYYESSILNQMDFFNLLFQLWIAKTKAIHCSSRAQIVHSMLYKKITTGKVADCVRLMLATLPNSYCQKLCKNLRSLFLGFTNTYFLINSRLVKKTCDCQTFKEEHYVLREHIISLKISKFGEVSLDYFVTTKCQDSKDRV